MASCAGLGSNSRRELIGEWRYSDATQSCHYIFKGDGFFAGEVTYRGKLMSKFTGRWSVEENAILYTYLSDEMKKIPAGAKDRDKLLRIQRDAFVIEAADGSRRRYFRIK